MRRILWFVLVALMLAAPAFAQVEVVARHRGTAPGPLSRERVAELLRAVAADLNTGRTVPYYGVLRKSQGNNCAGLSCDIVCTTDGRQFDVLAASPETAAPQWLEVSPSEANPQDGCELVPGSPPPIVIPPQPIPVPIPQPAPVVDWTTAIRAAVAECTAAANACTSQIVQHRKETRGMWESLAKSPITYAIVGAISSYLIGREVGQPDDPEVKP